MPSLTHVERILVPTDGSEPAERAADVAVDLAAAYDATIEALYVVDTTSAMAEFDLVVERLERQGERAVDSVVEAADAAGVEATPRLRRGRPHSEILSGADDVDVIVMGSHGRTGFDRFVHAGSVTERVVRHADVPVLVV